MRKNLKITLSIIFTILMIIFVTPMAYAAAGDSCIFTDGCFGTLTEGGMCNICGRSCAHTDLDPDTLICGSCGTSFESCPHLSFDRDTKKCLVCGKFTEIIEDCEHNFYDIDGNCQRCGYNVFDIPCDVHDYVGEICVRCRQSCEHSGEWKNGKCVDCGRACGHKWSDNGCSDCGIFREFQYTVSEEQATITKYCGERENVIIPSVIDGYTVTAVGNDAFSQCETIKQAELSETVKAIGSSAFLSCKSLTKVIIRGDVETIGDNAFAYCYPLEAINIPNTVTSIGYSAFFGCNSLKEIVIPDGVTTIEANVFNGCYSLAILVIPKSVTVVEDGAFSECDALSVVHYTGSEEEWNKISVETDNEDMTDKTRHYNTTVESIEYTCESDGYVNAVECDSCGLLYYDELISARHKYESGACIECGAACDHSDIIDGTCSFCNEKYEASLTVNNEVTYYYSLSDAIDEAKKNDGSVLKLHADISVSSKICVDGGRFTIDINGKNITGACTAFEVSGGEITFDDSVGSGLVDSTDEVAVYIKNGTVNIVGGKYTGETPIYSFGGTCIIDGDGVVLENYKLSTDAVSSAIYNSKGLVRFINGTMRVRDTQETYNNAAIFNYREGTTVIEGGTVIGMIGVLGGTVEINGGSFPEGIHLYNTTFDKAIGEGFVIRDSAGNVISPESQTDIEYAVTVASHTHTGGEQTCMGYKCDDCGQWYSEAEPDAHTWNAGQLTTQPTHTEYGEMTYTCDACGATKTEQAEKTPDHSFGDWVKVDENTHKRACACGSEESAEHNWNDGEITTQPTHTEYGEMTYTCDTCGTTKTEQAEKTPDHSFGEWVRVDDNTHKRTCVCGSEENADHNWNDGEVTTQPTHTEYGEMTYTCDACGTTKTEQAEKTPDHSFGEWVKVDGNTHKRACECGEEETENHTFGEWTVTKEATEAETGSKTKTCACGHTVTEEIPALGSETEAPDTSSDDDTAGDDTTDDDTAGGDTTGGETGNGTETEPESPDEGTPENPEEPRDRLNAGAVAGIVVGSITAVGLGGFAIFHFGIKKKKWSDLFHR